MLFDAGLVRITISGPNLRQIPKYSVAVPDNNNIISTSCSNTVTSFIPDIQNVILTDQNNRDLCGLVTSNVIVTND